MRNSTKSIKKWVAALFLFAIMIFATCLTCEAKELYSGKGYVRGYHSEWEKTFKVPETGHVVFKIDYSITQKDTINKFIRAKVGLANEKNKWVGEPLEMVRGNVDKVVKRNYGDLWYDDLSPGKTYKLMVKKYDYNYHKINFTYKIFWIPDYAKDIKIPSKITLNTGENEKLEYTFIDSDPDNSYVGLNEIRSSNEEIAEAHWGRNCIYIYPKKAGRCKIYITLSNERKKVINVTVKEKPALEYVSYTMGRGHTFQNKVFYTDKKVTWSSSDSSVASVSSTGKVTARKLGKCTITAKVGTKKLTCTVNVVVVNPDFGAVLKDYYTRDNYFIVRFCNKGDRDLTILSYGAKAEDFDYKSYDRYLSLGRNYTLKPNQQMDLKFYVNGGLTWYDHNDFRILFKFMYDGATYDGIAYTYRSIFEKGDTWYYTYTKSHEQWYKDWHWRY